MLRKLLAVFAFVGALQAQPWRDNLLAEFIEFLSIPNIASDTASIRRNAEALRAMMNRRGISTQLLEAAGAPPVVYGEKRVSRATRTLMFYAHYDGQPVTPSEWENGDPFKPVLKGDRLYGRSTSDDKAAIIAMMGALDRLGRDPTSNLKFFFEGEEEAGSPHLAEIVRKHKDLLKADLWLICDGPVHQSGRQQLYFGARGVTGLEITIYGALRELHSGHYGGWSPNPAVMLSHLIASMRDEDGRVRIAGFYDQVEPLSDDDKRAIASTPTVDAALRDQFGIGRVEGGGRRIEEIINEPTLNVRGLRSADTGSQARNVVPATATASIDIRLVKGFSPAHAQALVKEHIRKQGYFIADNEPNLTMRRKHPKIARITGSGGYAAARTPMNTPAVREIVSALEARGPVVLSPTLGGSVPLYIFEQELGAPFVGVPIANHDNNQHASNENIRLEMLWAGIETFRALMTIGAR